MTVPVPQGPPRLAKLAVPALVLGIGALILPIVGMAALDLSGVLFVAGIIVSILAIVFGSMALGEIKRGGPSVTGKGMALTGLILGIIALVMAVVAFVIMILVAFIIAAICAGCGGTTKTSAGVGLAFLGLGTRHGRPGTRDGLFAHHPDCGRFDQDVVRLYGSRVCVSCLTFIGTFAVSFLILELAPFDFPWSTLFIAGIALGTLQIFSFLGRTSSKTSKIFVKAIVGTGTGIGLSGLVASPLSSVELGAVLGLGFLLALCVAPLRKARIQRTCPDHAHP